MIKTYHVSPSGTVTLLPNRKAADSIRHRHLAGYIIESAGHPARGGTATTVERVGSPDVDLATALRRARGEGQRPARANVVARAVNG